MRYRRTMRVRFGHTDPAKIVYYPRFFEWFHDTMESMFEDLCGVSYAEILRTTGVGFPAVQVACEFLRPVSFGERVEIEVFFSRLSEKSATIEYRVRRDGVLLTTASVKIAGMDLSGRGSTPFPELVKKAFAPYVEIDQEQPNTSRIR
jgi:4-hydroxybenzoyl-CoA thioesterase